MDTSTHRVSARKSLYEPACATDPSGDARAGIGYSPIAAFESLGAALAPGPCRLRYLLYIVA